jgi:hypothetical protein
MRDRYIKMRNSKIIDANFFLDYALYKGFTYGVNEFNAASMYFKIDLIIQNLDSEYNLTILFDKQDKFIKVII